MSTYRSVISDPEEIRNARWTCGCGEEAPIVGPAYPICGKCGLRMRFVALDGQPYVVTAREEGEASTSPAHGAESTL